MSFFGGFITGAIVIGLAGVSAWLVWRAWKSLHGGGWYEP